ncbi:hypothetical protein APY94_06540 [Thermococcus celericrescens]|uniref:Uncharacterized protein n=1 Tax=Thermococcus celericrescens TaxID=227598 RepID=A0A117ITG3_9EURY|nr:hypothetical protein APY94_06540 [Thermococcus celericrescens]
MKWREKELAEKVSAYINRAEHYAKERRFEMAYGAYVDALYAIGAYVIFSFPNFALWAGYGQPPNKPLSRKAKEKLKYHNHPYSLLGGQ